MFNIGQRTAVTGAFKLAGYEGPLRTAPVTSDDERFFLLEPDDLAALRDKRTLEQVLGQLLGRKVGVVERAWVRGEVPSSSTAVICRNQLAHAEMRAWLGLRCLVADTNRLIVGCGYKHDLLAQCLEDCAVVGQHGERSDLVRVSPARRGPGPPPVVQGRIRVPPDAADACVLDATVGVQVERFAARGDTRRRGVARCIVTGSDAARRLGRGAFEGTAACATRREHGGEQCSDAPGAVVASHAPSTRGQRQWFPRAAREQNCSSQYPSTPGLTMRRTLRPNRLY
jgi:hypothetical protein